MPKTSVLSEPQNAATLKAAQANDVDGAVANYADDADWLPPNAPIVHGKTAIRAGWAKLIGNPGFTIDWQINKVEVARSGDLAYTIYTYQMALNGANGQPITDQGKDVAVWKKPDGAWKMVADTFNSDLAVKQAARKPNTKQPNTVHARGAEPLENLFLRHASLHGATIYREAFADFTDAYCDKGIC